MPTFLPPLPSRGEVDVAAIRRDCAAVRRMFKIEEGEPLEEPEAPEELEVPLRRAAVWGSGVEHRFQGERSASGMRPPPPSPAEKFCRAHNLAGKMDDVVRLELDAMGIADVKQPEFDLEKVRQVGRAMHAAVVAELQREEEAVASEWEIVHSSDAVEPSR